MSTVIHLTASTDTQPCFRINQLFFPPV